MLKGLKYLFSLFFTALIKIYQFALSPLLPMSCRHSPTCSQYTIEAIKIWGPFKGIWLGMKRLSKCHPWGTHGPDPVPSKTRNNYD